jgi:hypothetical protein
MACNSASPIFFVRVRAVWAVNQNTRIRTQRILFHQAESVAEKWQRGKAEEGNQVRMDGDYACRLE